MEIDAEKFDHIACTVFTPVYPLIADQIITHTGVTQGICMDVGCDRVIWAQRWPGSANCLSTFSTGRKKCSP